MISTVSFLKKEQTFLKDKGTVLVPVVREGDLTNRASVNIKLLDSSIYDPVAGQYGGQEWNAYWKDGEGGVQLVNFPVIPSSNKVEYLDSVLTNFVNCESGKITKTTLGLHNVDATPVFSKFGVSINNSQFEIKNGVLNLNESYANYFENLVRSPTYLLEHSQTYAIEELIVVHNWGVNPKTIEILGLSGKKIMLSQEVINGSCVIFRAVSPIAFSFVISA